jgi:hypothetical protein
MNEFLIKNRDTLISIPLRERSLQIFGDEKRLDSGLTNGKLFDGKLDPSVIGAFDPPLPFAAEGPEPPLPNAPILIIENHHTYSSFVTANQKFRGYSAVAWGVGQAFAKSARGLDSVLARYSGSQILYFGDLDGRGIRIPCQVNKARLAEGLMPIVPASALYEWLLDCGTPRVVDQESVGLTYEQAAIDWLGPVLAYRVRALWHESKRIAQENLSLDRITASHFNP